MPKNALKIDYTFISAREGGQKLTGYVPAAKNSKSGVTIATGFDLGARNEADLKRLNLPHTLVTKLKPCLGKQKAGAAACLEKNPLSVTKPEATHIDKAVKSKAEEEIRTRYNASIKSGKPKFSALPTEAQTVIASVAFQYGQLKTETPTFWKHVTNQDWGKAVHELRNFGDIYPTRRKIEADLLEKIVQNKGKKKPLK